MLLALRNLASLKKNITRRLRQVLEELQETLGHGASRAPQRVPVPIPVPLRNQGPFQRSKGFGCRFGPFSCKCPIVESARFFSTFFSYRRFRCGPFNDIRWSKANTFLNPHSFTGQHTYHQKAFKHLYRVPSLTQLVKKRFHLVFEDENDKQFSIQMRSNLLKFAGIGGPSLTLRFDLLTTPQFHEHVMKLAKPAEDPIPGCYVDFKVLPRIMIPSETVLSAEVLNELLRDLKRFEVQLHELQNDLNKIGELGELPLRFIGSEQTIRVYFPNCDREKLESLLLEKNVVGGIIHEDIDNDYQLSQSEGMITSVSDLDILSDPSLNSLPSLSSGSTDYDDILSSESSSAPDRIVRLGEADIVPESVEIVSDNEYHWV